MEGRAGPLGRLERLLFRHYNASNTLITGWGERPYLRFLKGTAVTYDTSVPV